MLLITVGQHVINLEHVARVMELSTTGTPNAPQRLRIFFATGRDLDIDLEGADAEEFIKQADKAELIQETRGF